MDPSEDEISQVIDFAGLSPVGDRLMVINALKQNNRNVETVVMQFFDNHANFRQKYQNSWDEDVFSADRDGNANSSGISFHIESVNQNDIIQGATPPPGYEVGAPSRPPSRSNDRSPLGQMVDWAANDAAGGAPSRSREDAEMQRALRESAHEAGLSMVPQETGIMEPSSSPPHFGPANRSDYDSSSWAMVPVASSDIKSVDEPRPSSRKRVAGAPAFLVQGSSSAGSHRLGGLLTILHQIPLARNILLRCGAPAAKYGYNSAWWKGQTILPLETLEKLQSEEMQWDGPDETSPRFEEEIHRLMGFLDSTERSYGTVSALTELIQGVARGPEKSFAEQLLKRNGDTIAPLNQIATMASVLGDDEGSEESNFTVLELEHLRQDYASIRTLYEAFDHLLWSDMLTWNESSENSKMAMLKKLGEVMVIQCGGDGPEDSFEIPLELYPARYLVEQKDEARRMQFAWNETKNAVAELLQEEKNLQAWRNDWNHDELDKNGVLKRARDQWQALNDYLKGYGHFQTMEASGFDTNKYPDYRAAPCCMTEDQQRQKGQVEDVLLLAGRVLADVETRAQGLRIQLERIQAKQRFLGRLLTVPDKPGRPKPIVCKKYQLRGVATATDVIYVCQRQETDLIEFGDESKPDQWWRLSYVSSDTREPVKCEKIQVERLLRDMWQETKIPLLVYATEEALNAPREPLKDALQHFVRSENRAFRQELSQEAQTSEERGRTVLDQISPSKRKHRDDSMDSMDTNRASLGSDDREQLDNPFEDRRVEMDVELSNFFDGNGSDGARSIEAEAEVKTPPTLPEREPRFRGLGELAMTPETLTVEEGKGRKAAPEAIPSDGWRHTVGEGGETKRPEMSEVGHPLTLKTTAETIAAWEGSQKGLDGKMDMEMNDLSEP